MLCFRFEIHGRVSVNMPSKGNDHSSAYSAENEHNNAVVNPGI